MTTPRWKVDIQDYGRGTVTYDGTPVPNIRKVTVECEAGKTPKASFEITGSSIQLALGANVTIKPFVQVIVGATPTGNLFDALSLERFLEIQRVADKYSFSLEDCCHAFVLLQKMEGADMKMLEMYCQMAKDSGEPVNIAAQRSLDLLKKLEGAP